MQSCGVLISGHEMDSEAGSRGSSRQTRRTRGSDDRASVRTCSGDGGLDGSGANSKNSTPYGGVKQVRVASSPSFLHIEG